MSEDYTVTQMVSFPFAASSALALQPLLQPIHGSMQLHNPLNPLEYEAASEAAYPCQHLD